MQDCNSDESQVVVLEDEGVKVWLERMVESDLSI